MRAQENVHFTSALPGPFNVRGGNYVLAVIGTFGGGSVTLQRLGPDGSTFITAATAITANGISAVLGLAPGSYQIAIVTATGVVADLTRVPVE